MRCSSSYIGITILSARLKSHAASVINEALD